MDKIINPLDGEMDLLGDTKSDIVRKLNPLNGRLEVVYKSDSYIQKINPFIGDFDIVGGTGASYIIKEVTGSGYINLTNAIANHLMELKAYGGIEQKNDISYAQGPCPTGFHVPTQSECTSLVSALETLGFDTENDGSCMYTYLKMPMAGNRRTNGTVYSGVGAYWSCTPYNLYDDDYHVWSSYMIYFYEDTAYVDYSMFNRTEGLSIRPFKDMPVAPNSSWTTLYSGTGGAGIFYNSTLGLISISGNGTNWITMADKNLGATTVYNNGDTLSEANCGKYFQRGNNYGFAWTGSLTTSSTKVDASGYGPGNYYSSSTFITGAPDWSSVQNDNLWGGVSIATTVPTPATPVDIVSNNGVLKVIHQSGLPTGYTQVEYLRSSGTQYIDLGYKGNGNTKVEVKFKYYQNTSATGSGRVFGSRITSSNNAFAIGTASGVVSTSGNKVFRCYDGQPYYIDEEDTFSLDEWQTVIFSATEHTLNGVTVGDDYEITEFETPNNLLLFAFDNNGTIGVGYVDIAYCKLWNNGVLVRDLIPCNNSSNVFGMYDRVSETLLTNAGTGTFTAGNTVSDPIEIYTVGTTETIEDELGNTATAEMLLAVGDVKDIQEVINGDVTRKIGIKVLTGDNTKDGLWGTSAGASNLYSLTIANSSTDNTFYPISTHFEGVLGSVGYTSIQDGQFKHGSSSTTYFFKHTSSQDVTAFKSYLAAQYNAGTPVIVVYPLATPITETVAGQTMNIQTGNNTIEITQASIDNLGLYAKYKATA